ncbi:tellurite resistance TerB family protein [Aliikangiella sp. IMCC44653]
MIGRIEIEDLTQSQNEALITLLVLLYRSDKKIDLGEQDYFQQVCERMNWKSGTSLDNFIPQAISYVRDHDHATVINQYCKPLTGYKEIKVILEKMAAADGELSAIENETIKAIEALI